MLGKIFQSSTPPAGQQGAGPLARNEQTSQNAAGTTSPATTTTNTLSASYQLDLSEAAQTQLASTTAPTNTPDSIRAQLDQIKASLTSSPANVSNLNKLNPQTVIDLLA